MPKRIPALSHKALKSARPTDGPVELADGLIGGLRARVYPSGKITWSLNIRDSKGRRRRFDVGSGLSLSDARKKAEDLRRAIREGSDPTAERRAARRRAQAAVDGIGTLDALLDSYFTTGPGSKLRSATKSKQQIRTVFQEILHKPVLDIGRAELQLVADARSSVSMASLAVRLLRPCLKWAEKRDLVRPGVSALEQPGTVGKRERVLTRDELKAIWPQLEGAHGDVVKWLLWTGCRLNEAAGMTWGEVEADRWTIPGARTKNGRERTIPLPNQARRLLTSLSPGQPDTLVFSSKRGGVLSNWDRYTKSLQEKSGTSGWHRHDLRRTVATIIGDLGFAPHVVTVVLGHAHVAEGATANYALSRYEREHCEALQALADELDRIAANKKNNVITLPTAM